MQDNVMIAIRYGERTNKSRILGEDRYKKDIGRVNVG
jgi:hypothetical protein